jgi:hypothetical protein
MSLKSKLIFLLTWVKTGLGLPDEQTVYTNCDCLDILTEDRSNVQTSEA